MTTNPDLLSQGAIISLIHAIYYHIFPINKHIFGDNDNDKVVLGRGSRAKDPAPWCRARLDGASNIHHHHPGEGRRRLRMGTVCWKKTKVVGWGVKRGERWKIENNKFWKENPNTHWGIIKDKVSARQPPPPTITWNNNRDAWNLPSERKTNTDFRFRKPHHLPTAQTQVGLWRRHHNVAQGPWIQLYASSSQLGVRIFSLRIKCVKYVLLRN